MKFVMQSGDRKLTDGKNVAVTYNETGKSCPRSCMLHPTPNEYALEKRSKFGRVSTCYTKKGRTNIHQEKAGAVDGIKLRVAVRNFLNLRMMDKGKGVTQAKRIDTVRWHVSGDVFDNDAPSVEYINAQVWACEQLDAVGVKSIGYTHGWNNPDVAPLRKWFMASCDTVEEVRLARSLGWMTTLVVNPKNKPTAEDLNGAKLVKCPNQITKGRVKCSSCMLCSPASLPSLDSARVIGFDYH
jgi:hypothetical protein